MAVGLLGGSAMPLDGEIRGCFIGHTWSHRKEHFYRALLESYAYELAQTLDSIHRMYPEWNRYTPIHVIGGGAVSDVWVQILTDATGSEFIRHSRDDAAMWGTAVLAGKAIGVFDDLKDLSEKADPGKEYFFPNPVNHRLYAEYAAVYEKLKGQLKDSYHELNKIG